MKEFEEKYEKNDSHGSEYDKELRKIEIEKILEEYEMMEDLFWEDLIREYKASGSGTK